MSKGKALVSVQVRNGDINKALKIFKKRGFNSGHLMELRERQEYTKPTVTKRKKKLDAVRRQNMQTIIEKIESGDKYAKLPTKKIKKK
jgi:small subunit ribosomal protein S21